MTVAFRVPLTVNEEVTRPPSHLCISIDHLCLVVGTHPKKTLLRLITSGWHGFGFLVIS